MGKHSMWGFLWFMKCYFQLFKTSIFIYIWNYFLCTACYFGYSCGSQRRGSLIRNLILFALMLYNLFFYVSSSYLRTHRSKHSLTHASDGTPDHIIIALFLFSLFFIRYFKLLPAEGRSIKVGGFSFLVGSLFFL